jgi:hypothetical protein
MAGPSSSSTKFPRLGAHYDTAKIVSKSLDSFKRLTGFFGPPVVARPCSRATESVAQPAQKRLPALHSPPLATYA